MIKGPLYPEAGIIFMVSGQDLRLDFGRLFNPSLPLPRVNPSNDFSPDQKRIFLSQITEENWSNLWCKAEAKRVRGKKNP